MADYIFARKSRNILSSFLHIILNILLGVGSIALTIITGSWTLGVLLVVISKWRVFAVRPRYWWLNIKSNLVDFIVGISFVLLAYCAGTTLLPIHFILAGFYTLWLIVLKPMSSETATLLQSLVAVFLGFSATALITATLDSLWAVAAAFIIGYGATRHILVQSDDRDFVFITFTCGLVAAEITWLCHSWLIVYSFGGTGIIIPQIAIIMTVLAFLTDRIYRAISKRDGAFRIADVAVPAIFSVLVIAIMLIWFSNPIFDI